MEAARFGTQSSHLYGGGLDLNRREKRVFGWDLNDWSWDSQRFVATPVQQQAANGSGLNSSPSSSEEAVEEVARNGGFRGDTDKRKRAVVIDDDETEDQGTVLHGGRSLSLRIGGAAAGVGAMENSDVTEDNERNGKKVRVQGGSSSGPACQVEDCGADLAAEKDYHRRHKVCEKHAKASTAVVGNTVQRFCQQCSRLVLWFCLLVLPFNCMHLFVLWFRLLALPFN